MQYCLLPAQGLEKKKKVKKKKKKNTKEKIIRLIDLLRIVIGSNV